MVSLKALFISAILISGCFINSTSLAAGGLNIDALSSVQVVNTPTYQLWFGINRYDACAGKQHGASCYFGKEGRAVNGSCYMRSNNKAICVSNAIKRAFKACKGKKVGDTCQFKGNHDDTRTGACVARKDKIACKPAKPL